MITIKRTNGQPDITEATVEDLEDLMGGFDEPTAYVGNDGVVCIYATEAGYDSDPEGAYPEIIVTGDGAASLAIEAGVDIRLYV